MRFDAFDLFLIVSALLVFVRILFDEDDVRIWLYNLSDMLIGVLYV